MKAVSIALRITDFLRKFPPFEFLAEDDLVALASEGRVKFHEKDEVIFSTGQPRDRFLHVINEGRVRIVEETSEGEGLIDLRGVGDILGLQGVLVDNPYVNTAIAETDILLYSLPRERFVALAERSPRAQRYLAAYFSLNPAYQQQSERMLGGSRDTVSTTLRKGGLAETSEPQEIARQSLVTMPTETLAREAAIRLRSKRIDCIVVVDGEGKPIGKLTDSDIRDRFIEGAISSEATVGDLMFVDLAFAKPGDSTGKLLVRLTRAGKRFLVVTEDGTADSRALGLVTERNIFLQYGRFPTLLGEAMTEAPDYSSLRAMRDRIEALILEFIEERTHIPWLMEMTGVLNRKLTARVLQLVEDKMAEQGWIRPKVDYCWMMMGSGGRDELLIRSAVYHALMYSDPDPEDAADTMLYFRELGRRASDGIRQCGFLESPQGILARNPEWCLPASAMHERFSDLIANPVGHSVYTFRDAFDFRPVKHQCELARALRTHISREVIEHPEFISHMAANSLLNQPPRTIYQDYVVDKQGIQKEDLEIKFHALLPLVDVGRVLALSLGKAESTATYKRLRMASRRLERSDPKNSILLSEAAEAFLVAAFARTQQGLISGTDGAVIRPADLDAEDRALLKTAFRTILSTLEYLADLHGLSLRT